MAGDGRQPLFAAALTGAALVLAADTTGRLILPTAELPAGVLTNLLGGPFLLWLLWRSRRSDV
jgi:iron complex transport system permease protein